MRILLIILLSQFLLGQNFVDRLVVPIYYQFNFATGYDSNVFSFSKSDLQTKTLGSNSLGEIKYYDSDYYKPQLKIIYSPVLLDQYETNFIFQLRSKIVRSFIQKNTISTSGKFEIKFGSYHWLKTGYSFTPENYLKRYQDADIFSNQYFDCTYSKASGFISYSVPINKKNWTRISWEISSEYYNSNFTEFDTEIHNFSWYLSHKFNSKLSYGLKIGIGDGNNISYYSGLNSTFQDRSYRTASIKISRSLKHIKFLKSDKFYISYSLDNRKYLNESIDDPLHSGRIHFDHQIYTSLTKKINSNFKINGYIKMRYRQTLSQFQWVEDIKSFYKTEFGIKLTWNGVYDIYR